MEAPWPEVGEGAWAASPTITIGPLCQVGTDGRSWVLSPASSRVPAAIRSPAGPWSPVNSSTSWRRHCSGLVAARSAAVTAGRGTLANQTVPPSGSTT
jgi:hypothetical protein